MNTTTHTKPLRIAVVGAGFFARFHIDAWRRMPDVELVGICDLDKALAQEAGAGDTAIFTDARAMIETLNPDLLDIATPPQSHKSLVQLAAATGTNAICQKPVAPDLAQTREIVTCAEAANIVLVIHENIRFMPWYRELKTLLDTGIVGNLTNLSMRLRPGDGRGPDAYLDRQPYFQQMQRFLVHETAIHWIDTFRFLAGECEGVFARLKKLNPAIAGEDAGTIVFDFANNITGLFDGNRLVDHETDNPRRTMGETLVEGTEGTIRIDGRARIWLRRVGESETEHSYQWRDVAFGGDCVYAFQRHVADHLLNGSVLENDAKAYLANVEIAELVYQSSEQGQFLKYN